jgi:uncharacterized metal-binding protein YceD (DUF177 family)
MSLKVNLRHLEAREQHLQGESPVKDLDLDVRDEVIQLVQPLHYDLHVEKLDDGILAQGKLRLVLDCECVRCLKPFQYEIHLPEWACHLALTGEEAAAVVHDCVDLTPYVREDILLEFPQHPLCNAECGGLPKPLGSKRKRTNGATDSSIKGSVAWSELNKLKF